MLRPCRSPLLGLCSVVLRVGLTVSVWRASVVWCFVPVAVCNSLFGGDGVSSGLTDS